MFITHGHLDHAGGAELAQKYNIEIEGPHKDDGFLINALKNKVNVTVWIQPKTLNPIVG